MSRLLTAVLGWAAIYQVGILLSCYGTSRLRPFYSHIPFKLSKSGQNSYHQLSHGRIVCNSHIQHMHLDTTLCQTTYYCAGLRSRPGKAVKLASFSSLASLSTIAPGIK